MTRPWFDANRVWDGTVTARRLLTCRAAYRHLAVMFIAWPLLHFTEMKRIAELQVSFVGECMEILAG